MSYIANSEADRQAMLREIGVQSFEELIQYIPEELRLKRELDLPQPLSELEAVAHLEDLANRNKRAVIFAGAGAYDHYVPAAVRHILWRSEFYTAYTPYQPEVSQGTLQAIYEYQTYICRLTGMDVANASMYDGGSALAEAVLMAANHTRRHRVLVPENINPNYVRIIETYTQHQDIELVRVPLRDGIVDDAAVQQLVNDDTAAVLLQHPNFYGLLENPERIGQIAHEAGALFITFVDPISLVVLQPPGEYGADIVVGEGQALGNALNFGGPYLGIFAATRPLIRKMPGRIVGRTVDIEGRTAYVTVLQTREQHIRREKATSNICTNSQLCALAATVYLSLLGEHGIRRAAEKSLSNSHYLARKIAEIPGFKLKFDKPFFKEFAVETPVPAREIIDRLADEGIIAGVDLESMGMGSGLLIAVTEKRTQDEMDQFIAALNQFKR
ncbi:MAG TPA: aminomethyl-transferring glycine dehydrogenase subunit GcvPA [Calditrichae bacterium]|nr:aminomethyl-transferring glycine dehydrogenase subunit GcvPA [Calditrichia bacterium]